MMSDVAVALIGARVSAEGFARVNCPFCEAAHHSGRADTGASLAVRPDTGWYKCWRCGTQGRDRTLTDDTPPPPVPVAAAPAVEIDLPDGFIPLWCAPGDSAIITSHARAYLQRRGVGLDALAGAQVGYVRGGWYDNRVVVQVLEGGKRLGWVARSLDPAAPKKYLNPKGMHRAGLLFNGDALLVPTNTPAIVEEGVFDALPYWPDGVACLGKPTHDQTWRLCKPYPRPIAVALDGDARKEGWALAMELRMAGRAASGYVELPAAEDPGSVDPAWLRAAALACIGAPL